MRSNRVARLLAVLVATCAVVLGSTGVAVAHEERESTFPAGTGTTPTYRPFDPDAPFLVVCKPGAARVVAQMQDDAVRAFNERLLQHGCDAQHLQAAVDQVTERGTNIYVLPGTYREEPSWAPECTESYDGGIVDYQLVVSCGEVINLVTVAGDSTPDTREVTCNALCDLQIEGTGERMEDVVLRGGFTEDGDWIKHNGLKADRADGFYVRNMTFELFRENALYVHETDGYVIDRVNARHNDLYGILTFTSDHGLIQDCDASYNGDSGVYPGSAADVNRDSTVTGPLQRYAVEIRRCNTHHNALGFSGTAGNSVWFHDNLVHHNQAGYVTDSFVGGHPGMPQDHAWLTGNRIYANNNNYVAEFVHSGVCARKPAERGYEQGTVCPAFPVPVGTGVLIAGGNHNFVTENVIYDNWRAGAMLFWVPGAVRGDFTPTAQLDTSNGNHYTNNRLGRHPDGFLQPNGVDFSWDEQGTGNCWEGNVSATGEVTDDVVLLPLPGCAVGSLSPVGNVVKSATMVSCATYNREDEPDPAGCDWFDNPAVPAGRQAAPDDEPVITGAGGSGGAAAGTPSGGDVAPQADAPPQEAPAPLGLSAPATDAELVSARGLPATGTSVPIGLAGLVLVGAVLVVRRRVRAAA